MICKKFFQDVAFATLMLMSMLPTSFATIFERNSKCVNIADFAYKNKANKNCDWVAKKSDRCEKKWNEKELSFYCPESCGLCSTGTTKDSNGICEDDPDLQYKNKDNKNCAWVGRDPNKRCGKFWNSKLLEDFCPVSCYKCEGCNNTPIIYDDDARKTCNWVARSPNSRCILELDGKTLDEYCPLACDTCPVPLVSPTPTGGDLTQCQEEIVVDVTTDNYPGETSWSIVDTATGVAVFSKGDYTSTGLFSTVVGGLCKGLEYSFVMDDSYGDGICCAYGNGSFLGRFGDLTLFEGGEFGSEVTIPFTIPLAPTDSPSAEPTTEAPTNFPTQQPTDIASDSPSAEPTTEAPTNFPTQQPTDISGAVEVYGVEV